MKRILIVMAMICTLAAISFADHATLFKVRIENISTNVMLKSTTGATAPVAFSPGIYVVHTGINPIFMAGKPDAGKGLERQAEDGNPGDLMKSLDKSKGVMSVGIFNIPEGAKDPGAITPGGAYEFTFSAHPGSELSLAQMFGQSNDAFYSNAKPIALFDKNGTPVSGDLTAMISLWDAGTEVNQEPGFGPDQAPRQSTPNTGKEEHNAIGPLTDGFTYPSTDSVIRIMISHQ